MKRAAGLLLTLIGAGGCVATGVDFPPVGQCGPMCGPPMPPVLRGAIGPYGEPVTAVPPVGPHAPGAVAGVGPEVPFASPASRGVPMVPPNPVTGGPGMGPGQAMIIPMGGPGPLPPAAPSVVPASFANPAPAQHAALLQRSQVRFVGPKGAKVGWYVAGQPDKDGRPVLMPAQLDIPGRYNFLQGAIYRLKLSNIPGRPGLELYPTIEVVPANAKTEAFLAHNYIPVEFTEEDLDQVASGNFITKVIYLPDAQYQSPTGAGPEELVSTRLEPGVDPVAEAHRRGHILLVVRVGGIDLEVANAPAITAPGPYGPPQSMMPPILPGMAAPRPLANPSLPPGAPQVAVPAVYPSGPMVPAKPGTLPGSDGNAVQQSGQSPDSATRDTGTDTSATGPHMYIPTKRQGDKEPTSKTQRGLLNRLFE